MERGFLRSDGLYNRSAGLKVMNFKTAWSQFAYSIVQIFRQLQKANWPCYNNKLRPKNAAPCIISTFVSGSVFRFQSD